MRTAADLGTLGDVARARRRGDQARGPGRRAVDRPRHVPRRGGRRDDGRARHVARPRPSPPATPPRRSRTTRTCPSRSATKLRGLGRPELDAFRLAAEAGVKVAMGTDCPVAPHGTNLNELRTWRRTASRPSRRCVAATSSAAELMGLQDELGTLEPGKRADVVVVDGDPFAFDDAEGARSSGLEGRRAGRLTRYTTRSPPTKVARTGARSTSLGASRGGRRRRRPAESSRGPGPRPKSEAVLHPDREGRLPRVWDEQGLVEGQPMPRANDRAAAGRPAHRVRDRRERAEGRDVGVAADARRGRRPAARSRHGCRSWPCSPSESR